MQFTITKRKIDIKEEKNKSRASNNKWKTQFGLFDLDFVN